MHAAGTLPRDRQSRLHRDMQLRRRSAVAHREDMHLALAIGRRVRALLAHVDDLGQQLACRREIAHADGDRPEPADLMCDRNGATLPRMRLANAAIIDETEALSFGILEFQRRTAIDVRRRHRA